MEVREQVFVSSTFIDLREEREKVIQGLLEADCFPAGMELFPASDDEKWQLIQGVIDDSDYYLLILGGRYGSVDVETELSYTEMEFDYAVKQGKPVMAFVHGKPDAISVGRTDKDSEKAKKLELFRAKVEKKMVKPWTTAEQLPGFVAQALMKTRKAHPAVGWVRGDKAQTPEVELEISQLKLENEKLRSELSSKSKVGQAPIEGLSEGSDVVSLGLKLTYSATDGTTPGGTVVQLDFDVSWDALLSDLGPLLLQEVEESALDEGLLTFLRIVYDRDPTRRPSDLIHETDFSTYPEDVHTVVVQFLALRLIQKGTQKRAVSDAGRYWTLSDLGRERLMMLRAVRKKIEVEPPF